VVKLLLDAGQTRMDVNKENSHGSTPLSVSCVKGFEEIVKLFLAPPAMDVKKKNHYGSTPFYLACQAGNAEIVRLLLKNPAVEVNRSTPRLCLSLAI